MSSIAPKKYPYDVVIVLAGGLYVSEGKFYPTEYEHSDEFGMLGGSTRVDAAVALYSQEKAINFLFSAGVSAKQVGKFGPSVPPEANIYAEAFLERLATTNKLESRDRPRIFLEAHSANTAGSLLEVVTMIGNKGWRKAVFISSDYQIPRVAALFELLTQGLSTPLRCATEFLSAERIVCGAYPGVYDAKIEAAYTTPAALTRLKNERRGLEDIRAGRYIRTEYQLHKPQ